MSEESDVEKTEEPTAHRREKARKEGQVPRSRELTSLLMLLTGWGLVFISGEKLLEGMAQVLAGGLTFGREAAFDTLRLSGQVIQLLEQGALMVLPLLLGLCLCAITGSLLLGGLNFSGKALAPDIKRISLLSGFKRIFSLRLFTELVRILLKVVLVFSAGMLCLRTMLPQFIHLSAMPMSGALHKASQLISHGLLMVICALIPLVGYDILSQLREHLKKLRMSRQDIRDEMKQQEGDPHIKSRIRQLQYNRARQRMMAALPDADVIVNNPTHFSVALRYKEGAMKAPVVLAKGAGETALRIREAGKRYNIPMLEAPPLARSLFRHCEIGEPIPSDLYGAVAEVLAWVYGLRLWRSGKGLPPRKPTQIAVPPARQTVTESDE